jgi:hypothetical protein
MVLWCWSGLPVDKEDGGGLASLATKSPVPGTVPSTGFWLKSLE